MELAKSRLFSLNFLKLGLVPKEIFLFLAFTGAFSVLAVHRKLFLGGLPLPLSQLATGNGRGEDKRQLSGALLGSPHYFILLTQYSPQLAADS